MSDPGRKARVPPAPAGTGEGQKQSITSLILIYDWPIWPIGGASKIKDALNALQLQYMRTK